MDKDVRIPIPCDQRPARHRFGAANRPATTQLTYGSDIHSEIFPSYLRTSTRTALIDSASGKTVSYRRLLSDIDALSASLYTSLGFQKWDTVAIVSPNHLEYPVIVHAVLKAGGTISPANSNHGVAELAYQIKDSGAKFLFVHPKCEEVAIKVVERLGLSLDRVVFLGDEACDATGGAIEGQNGWAAKTVSQLLEEGRRQKPVVVTFTQDEITEKPAYLCYSSGTTGLPKGVLTTHYNAVANARQFMGYVESTREVVPDSDTWIAVLPFYHIYGLIVHLHHSFRLGLTVVVFPKFDFKELLRCLALYGVTSAHLVPPIVIALGKHPLVDQFKFPKLRSLVSGAAPLAPELSALVYKRLGIRTRQGFGMTETSPLCLMIPVSSFVFLSFDGLKEVD
ncbi:hypothetical protein HDU98_011716 [Podochytrium sp. JEL0797]|nr:hypothetical protein HDU98_011716 [Podochytrium sp. JEL0797]